MMTERESDTVEAGALVERVAGTRKVQISQKRRVSYFCSGLSSQCFWDSEFDLYLIYKKLCMNWHSATRQLLSQENG